jgi:hypothetical protein
MLTTMVGLRMAEAFREFGAQSVASATVKLAVATFAPYTNGKGPTGLARVATCSLVKDWPLPSVSSASLILHRCNDSKCTCEGKQTSNAVAAQCIAAKLRKVQCFVCLPDGSLDL